MAGGEKAMHVQAAKLTSIKSGEAGDQLDECVLTARQQLLHPCQETSSASTANHSWHSMQVKMTLNLLQGLNLKLDFLLPISFSTPEV